MYNYKWKLKDTVFTKDKGNVFSCFACGGGSSMGYKLAGFDVIGVNEIDPRMMEVYKVNHNPKYSYLEGIQAFKDRNDLPGELFDLDILDGSPPCSSFSMAGNREKDWGKEKKFREGQAEQVLDTLFFDFIDLAGKLKPKVVIAENVKGILLGNAFKYVKEIYKRMDKSGYYLQHWLLDASKMGVPQRRERVFFIGLRKDLAEPFMESVDLFTQKPKLILSFNEPEIAFDTMTNNLEITLENTELTDLYKLYWQQAKEGKTVGKFGAIHKAWKHYPLNTITTGHIFHPFEMRTLGKQEYCVGGSYPLDYNFIKNDPKYLIGMSVPPVMIAQIANQVYKQWLSKMNP